MRGAPRGRLTQARREQRRAEHHQHRSGRRNVSPGAAAARSRRGRRRPRTAETRPTSTSAAAAYCRCAVRPRRRPAPQRGCPRSRADRQRTASTAAARPVADRPPAGRGRSGGPADRDHLASSPAGPRWNGSGRADAPARAEDRPGKTLGGQHDEDEHGGRLHDGSGRRRAPPATPSRAGRRPLPPAAAAAPGAPAPGQREQAGEHRRRRRPHSGGVPQGPRRGTDRRPPPRAYTVPARRSSPRTGARHQPRAAASAPSSRVAAATVGPSSRTVRAGTPRRRARTASSVPAPTAVRCPATRGQRPVIGHASRSPRPGRRGRAPAAPRAPDHASHAPSSTPCARPQASGHLDPQSAPVTPCVRPRARPEPAGEAGLTASARAAPGRAPPGPAGHRDRRARASAATSFRGRTTRRRHGRRPGCCGVQLLHGTAGLGRHPASPGSSSPTAPSRPGRPAGRCRSSRCAGARAVLEAVQPVVDVGDAALQVPPTWVARAGEVHAHKAGVGSLRAHGCLPGWPSSSSRRAARPCGGSARTAPRRWPGCPAGVAAATPRRRRSSEIEACRSVHAQCQGQGRCPRRRPAALQPSDLSVEPAVQPVEVAAGLATPVPRPG